MQGLEGPGLKITNYEMETTLEHLDHTYYKKYANKESGASTSNSIVEVSSGKTLTKYYASMFLNQKKKRVLLNPL